MKYFLDTFALMEYLAGNKAYLKYFSEQEASHELRTSILNLMELYFHVLQDAGENAAEDSFAQFKQLIVPFNDDDVKNAMKFRLRSRAKRLDISYTDALGYTLSTRLDSRFLTGDKAFKGLDNVEFVK